MVTNTNSAIETRRFDKDSISTVFSAGSMYIASLVLDELKDKHSAQLGIVKSQDSAIRDVVCGLSSLKMSITEAEAVTDQTLNTDLLHLSTNQRNSLSQFLADCRSLKSFLDTCALLPADIQNSSLPEEQKLRIQQLISEAVVKTTLAPPQVKDGEYSVNLERIPDGLQAL